MATLTPVAVPDIGDFTDVPVIEILVAEGDAVELDSPLVTLESDKATMEVPSPVAGVVKKLLVKLGDKVSEGVPLVEIEANGTPAAPAPRVGEAAAAPSGSAEPDSPPPPPGSAPFTGDAPAPPDAGGPPPPTLADGDGSGVHASPLARRVARELGVDLGNVHGTGRNGRILREDVEAAAAAPSVPRPAGVTPLQEGDTERVPLSRIQKIAAPRLEAAWQTIPHVTHHEEADITELEDFRKQVNAEHPETKVTMVALLMKAVVATLREFPDFNASLEGDEIVRKRFYNLGFAADTPHGLMVPVIRAVDRKGLLEVADELRALSAKAREGKIGPADLQGGTFTISSLGGIGGTGFTPIVNAPEVAILGVTRSATKPVWDGTAFQPRLVVPLSLSYDHRVIDGAAAARFMVHLREVLEDLRRVLL